MLVHLQYVIYTGSSNAKLPALLTSKVNDQHQPCTFTYVLHCCLFLKITYPCTCDLNCRNFIGKCWYKFTYALLQIHSCFLYITAVTYLEHAHYSELVEYMYVNHVSVFHIFKENKTSHKSCKNKHNNV